MENSKVIIAIIPARGGSKGVPRKNIKLLAGKPLIAYTIEAAMKSKYISRVLVSTEDEEIAEISEKNQAEVIRRPRELSQDDTPTEPVIIHALEFLFKKESFKPEISVLLQPTSPLRRTEHIDEALKTFLVEDYDSLLSVYPTHIFLWKTDRNGARSINYDFKRRPRRQEMVPIYAENGAIYITKCEVFLREQNRLGGRVGLYVMAHEYSIEIDSDFDFWLCEQIIRRMQMKEGR